MIAPSARTHTVSIERLWGFCPVQALGTINERPFYFRAHLNCWTFSVAAAPTGDPVQVSIGQAPGWHVERRYGRENEHDASFMPHSHAHKFIMGCARSYLNEVNK